MSRVIAVAACGLTLTACTSWMPSFDMPSLGGSSSSAPAGASLAVESDPPGAQASTQGGGSCVTPCRLAVTASGPFTVNIALNGYVPQSVPVRIMQPDDPRLGSEDSGGSGARLDPNPVYVELERAPPTAPPAHNKKKAAPKRPATAAVRSAPATEPTTASVPTTTSTVGTSTMAPQQPPPPASSGASWPMPR